MRLGDYINKPEYIHRPSQVLRRIWRGLSPMPSQAWVTLPWGLSLNVRPHEVVGRAIWLTGAFELAVSEMIWRSLRPGDLAADVGANVGYHTSLMACRCAGLGGCVRAFEPHPIIHGELASSVARWPKEVGQTVDLRQAAVTSVDSEVVLHIPKEFAGNRGVASVEAFEQASEMDRIVVKAVSLDREFEAPSVVRLMKLDVEGHELSALAGARELLMSGRLRTVIFEDHCPMPSAVTNEFTRHGYSIFKLLKTVSGPFLEPIGGPTPPLPFEAPNYVATLDPDECFAIASSPGWQCLV